MTVEAIQSVGSEASKAIQQYMQTGAQPAPAESTAVNSFPAAAETPAPVGEVAAPDSFLGNVADTVYTEIDALGSKLPTFAGEQSAVSSYKESLVPTSESLSPMETTKIDNGKDDAVAALSKTFDHAVFMAMVNQVISGVSDTSRTLIRQS
ncbi:MAG: hypothetical protein AAF412_04840 [Pseudomonadota bacterium]